MAPKLADGWRLDRLTPPSRLFGANGLRTGPDGRIYVAQVTGSQISALDIETGALETISAMGGDIVGPDDLAFDPCGELFATEPMEGRVSARSSDGRTRVVRDDLPAANGITVHRGRLFVNECRVAGRLMELDPAGGAPRVLLDNVPMPNAMEVGPDGLLYYPVMGTNEIWRIDPDGGEPERVAGDLGVPDSVKFDSQGRIVSTQVYSGEVVRIDPRTGDRSVLATLPPGLDNCTFVGDRLFVSSFTGEITEILDGGQTRTTLPGGLNWPLDLTVDENGNLYIADWTYLYVLHPGHEPRVAGMLSSPGFPGFVRGVDAIGGGEFIVTTATGSVARYRPASQYSAILAEGLDQPYGVAIAPNGVIAAAEFGTGRVLLVRSGQFEVLASGLREPVGVAFGPDGTCYASESGAGRIVSISDSGADTVVDGLDKPQGILICDRQLYIVDVGAKMLINFDLDTRVRDVIACDLPVGAPPGITPRPLRGIPPLFGPEGPFAGIAAGSDGTLYLSADAEGSVLAIRNPAM
ncbi:SMP-30/gluconolactonase/LRE family protein [Nocardia carnea]|uniref:SMP-30/gluconolactonase/LRE family protein n=1 Tax=Nocardia carnea TaxID=37328 RepID=UPI0024564F9A|nr:SMP-30/gluconolactonase/LRE family protein [Nocardia carnea]